MQENSFYRKYFPELNYLIINTKPSNFFNPRNMPYLYLDDKEKEIEIQREENKFIQTDTKNPNNEEGINNITITYEKFISNPLFKGKIKI